VIRVARARADELARCLAIRRRVFVEEQRVPSRDERDGHDEACLHWLAAELKLHAQMPVVSFYERLGYTAEGPVFDEAGILHRSMKKSRPPC